MGEGAIYINIYESKNIYNKNPLNIFRQTDWFEISVGINHYKIGVRINDGTYYRIAITFMLLKYNLEIKLGIKNFTKPKKDNKR